MEMIFHSHANKTHFHKKGCAPSLILKVRVFGTRKWPIPIYEAILPKKTTKHELPYRREFFEVLYNFSSVWIHSSKADQAKPGLLL